MGNYACINDLALIEQWCSATETPADESCPVADPVFLANGNVMLSEVDFASGDTSPLVFRRTYSDSTGKFYSETTRTGLIRRFMYDGMQRLSGNTEWPVDNVVPAAATSIRLDYDSDDRIVKLVDPLGMPTSYAYDAKGNVVSVTAPYGHVRQYLYEDTRFPNALTGVKDESG